MLSNFHSSVGFIQRSPLKLIFSGRSNPFIQLVYLYSTLNPSCLYSNTGICVVRKYWSNTLLKFCLLFLLMYFSTCSVVTVFNPKSLFKPRKICLNFSSSFITCRIVCNILPALGYISPLPSLFTL